MSTPSPCATCAHLPEHFDECLTTLWTTCWGRCGAGHKIVWQEWDAEGVYRRDGTGWAPEVITECEDQQQKGGAA